MEQHDKEQADKAKQESPQSIGTEDSDARSQESASTTVQDSTPEDASPTETNEQNTDWQQQAAHYEQRWVRARADAENAARKAERAVKQAHLYGLESFSVALLEVKDNLERSLDTFSQLDAERMERLNELGEGLELTLKQLHSVFTKFGIEECDPIGQVFNPDAHQAVQTMDSDEHPPKTVLKVIQKGYWLNQRLIRPALVVVASAPKEPDSSPDEAEKPA